MVGILLFLDDHLYLTRADIGLYHNIINIIIYVF